MAIVSANSYLNTIQAAYSPILFTVEDDGTSGGSSPVPPVVYCDVYCDGTFYKTISSTSPTAIVGILSFWKFDISGISQEYLTTKIPDITSTAMVAAGAGQGMTVAFCKFRNSTIDAFGIVTPQATIPIQATIDSAAVAGDGFVADSFIIVNAALQVMDSVNLEDQLSVFRITSFPGTVVNTNNRVYPLSYLINGKIYANDWGLFPFITCQTAFSGLSGMVATITGNLTLFMFDDTSSLIYSATAGPASITSSKIYTVPIGLKNIVALFPGAAAFIDQCSFYRVLFINSLTSLSPFTVFATPPFYIQQGDGVVPAYTPILQTADDTYAAPKHTRIWFQNYLGHFDFFNFIERVEELKVTSSPTESPVTVVLDGAKRSNTSMSRNNVRSNDYSQVTGLFNESDLPFIKQLFASSKTYIEFVSPEGGGDPPKDLILPIVLVDGSYDTQSWDDRYEYRIDLKYYLSDEHKTTRN